MPCSLIDKLKIIITLNLKSSCKQIELFLKILKTKMIKVSVELIVIKKNFKEACSQIIKC